MKLSKRLEDEFKSVIRQRGQAYYWQHLIRIRSGDARHVEADVTGTERYGITLYWDAPFLTAWCDCPFFEQEGPCKHVWGTILAADAQDYLSEAANAPELILDEESDGVEDEDFDDEEDEEEIDAPLSAPAAAAASAKSTDPPQWKQDVNSLVMTKILRERLRDGWPAKREVVYQIDVQASVVAGNLVLGLETRDRKSDGNYTSSSRASIKRSQLAQLPVVDREILSLVGGAFEYHGWGDPEGHGTLPWSSILPPGLAAAILPAIVKTGRCFLKKPRQAAMPVALEWDEGEPWHFELEMKEREITGWVVTGFLRRGEDRVELSETNLVVDGFVFIAQKAARLEANTQTEWLKHMRRTGGISASDKDGEALMAELLTLPDAPPLKTPAELAFDEIAPVPRRLLKIRTRPGTSQTKVSADLIFDYDGTLVSGADKRRGVYDSSARRFVKRDATTEEAAATTLREIGFRQPTTSDPSEDGSWHTHTNKVPAAVRKLIESGWHVEAEGKIFRRPGAYRVEVSSGVDWFELHGEVQYGDTTATLPELLEAVRRGETTVRLGDGTFGVLPEEWMARIGLVAGLGTAENGHIRFRENQAGLLDALLAAEPEISYDETFQRIRKELTQFESVKAAAQPAGFSGHLRDYQRESLGWMEFLRRMSFGGCLADDMGVGKTAQVLALLETRRELRVKGEVTRPSLVVVPRSLVFNWMEESARFTPKLRILDYTGAVRAESDFEAYDVILTTYGTLRRDAPRLKDIDFDYLILDEAQAIKNAGTESAKAVRLLKGSHRLALSGTPVENHLGELFSLFEFLNPGMLNAANVFKLAGSGGLRNLGEENLTMLARALRPFILRRTKEEVARELPAKTEQTIYCELKAPQRKLYNELREHYRNAILGKIAKDGMGKAKIQVLEALLRLRQAACHPALIDAKRGNDVSAKMEALMAQLREVTAEGHKALVFSQFTSFLKIVRARLDEEGLVYEYLDGATRDRQAPVERFQNDADCKLFLISLKAGGLGLNLTAAGYVFLLDPWWNPAVEAQAVDRAHRIGQTQQVFAYRLIARDTVEEKVLELQKTKRDLASAIISQDNSLIKNLQKEDLELLLS